MMLHPKWLLMLILGSSAGLSTTLDAQNTSTVGDSNNSVAGIVLNAKTGAAVPRALVKLNDRAVLTDREGRFRFEQYAGSSRVLTVSKPGFYPGIDPADRGEVSVPAVLSDQPIELRLYPEALLTGDVVSQDARLLSSINVSALRRTFDNAGSRWTTVAMTRTDSHGGFRLPVPAGEFRVETQYMPLDITTGESVLPVHFSEGPIYLHNGEELHITLRALSRHPYNVAVIGSPEGHARDAEITAWPDSGGEFRIAAASSGPDGQMKLSLPEGRYTLRARRGDAETPEEAEAEITVPNHDISGVVLRFTPVASIPVELTEDETSTSGTALPNVQQFVLALQNRDEQGALLTPRNTSSQGREVVFLTPAGRYHLQFQNRGSWFIKSAVYGDSDLFTQDLVVAPGAGGGSIRLTVSNLTGGLQGAVTVEGSPRSGCRIYVISEETGAVIDITSNSEGNFTISNLPPGGYRAIAFEGRFGEDYSDASVLAPFLTHVREVTITAEERSTVSLEAVPVAEILQ